MSRFKPIKCDMNYLFPPSMSDWLPAHHLARFIVEIVEQLDLKAMERAYGTSGSAPFHPALLLPILVYGYATGVFSNRKLANATYDSIAFRFVAAEVLFPFPNAHLSLFGRTNTKNKNKVKPEP